MDVPRANEAKGSENFLPFPSTNTEILARGVTVLPFLPLAARSLMKMEGNSCHSGESLGYLLIGRQYAGFLESFETAISSLNPRHALLRRRSRVYMFIPPVPYGMSNNVTKASESLTRLSGTSHVSCSI